jgi:hypothetical protein
MFFGAQTKSVGFKPIASNTDQLKTYRLQNLLNVNTFAISKVDF